MRTFETATKRPPTHNVVVVVVAVAVVSRWPGYSYYYIIFIFIIIISAMALMSSRKCGWVINNVVEKKLQKPKIYTSPGITDQTRRRSPRRVK